MPTKLTTRAIEESTYIITISFTDEDDAAVTPNDGMIWTLTDKAGTVINSRSAVAVTEASTIEIVLSGDDLALGVGDNGKRVLTIQGTYDSDAGSDLPLKDEVEFSITNLINVT